MIQIRPADLEADRELLIDRLHRYLTPRSNAQRYDWLYLDNPHGRAAAWIATDDSNGEIVGSGTIVPRRIRCQGGVRLAPVMADFWVHPNYRSLGPALQLQRACIDGIRGGACGFFDLPQANMWVVYKRLGLLKQDRLVRFAKPLHAGDHVRKKLGVPALSTLLGGVATLALDLHDRYRAAGGRAVIELQAGDIGEEFSGLAAEVGERHGICVDRSAEYLTWRYGRHYHLRHEIYCARVQGRLRSYAIVVLNERDAQVVDLFGADDDLVLRELLLSVARALRARGYASLNVALLEGHSWGQGLQGNGFSAREASPAIVHTFEPQARGEPRPAWLLTYGDFDN